MFIYRLLSAAVLIPITAWIVYAGGLWFLTTIAVVAGLAGYEFCRIMRIGGYKPAPFFSLALIMLFLVDAHYPAWEIGPLGLTAVIVLSLIWQLFQKDRSAPTVDWALTLVGGLYVGWMARHFIALRDGPQGLEWAVLAVLTTWAGDTGAYAIGHWVGRHKFWPRLSPGKTWEGTVGGWLCGIAVGAFLGWAMGAGLVHGLIVGALVAFISPFGDLGVSMMKRQVGVKDSWNIIPGHGGFLDRIDSLLFSAAVVYYYAHWVVGI